METPQQIVRKQFSDMHGFLRMAIDGCDQETANAEITGGTIQPLGTIVAHILMSEDFMVNGLAAGRAPFSQRAGWAERLGLPGDASPALKDDMARARPDIARLREFEQALAADVDEAIAGLSDARLAEEIEAPNGRQTVLAFLAGIAIQHLSMHTGEVSALRGVQGQQGLPF